MTTDPSPLPATLASWQAGRSDLRAMLWRALGDLPPLPTGPRILRASRAERPGYLLERFTLDNGAADFNAVPGVLLLPAQGRPPYPAVLYLHAHGGQYDRGKDELFLERVPGVIPAEALTQRGYAVMAIDAYGFGEREGITPDGQPGFPSEASLAKYFLWQGMTMWGMIVRDDRLALDYLASRPEIDARRIAATGMSMGSTRAFWLAAFEERVASVVTVACLTRYADLLAHGALKHHNVYFYVPGALKTFDLEHVVSLIAPRPFLNLIGDRDPGSPLSGVEKAVSYLEQLYALYGKPQRFRNVVYPGVAHEYTPAMWEAMVAWLDSTIRRG